MNGEFAELLKEIKAWSNEVHGQRHQENLEKFSLIFTKLDSLPCKERNGIYNSHETQLKVICSLVICMVAAIVGAFLKK